MTRALVLLFLLAAPTALAGAEDYAAGEPATGYHTQKKMTRNAEGDLYYAVLRATNVTVVHRDAEGRETTLPPVLAARGGQSRPSITLDSENVLHLAWTERADEDREVFAASYQNGAWVGITQLSRGEGYAGFPSLAADARGRVHVAWYGFDGAHYQTFHRVWEAGSWAPATQLSAGPLDANNPSIVVAEDGTAHVAWYKDEGHRYSVWHASRAPDGAWTLARRLPQGDADALNVALALDAAGALHAVWDERHDDGFHVIHAALAGDSGWTPPDTLAAGDVGGEYPAIARWGDAVLVAWRAPNGTLVARDLVDPPAPLAGAPRGSHVSLRGAQAAPAGDREVALDILYTDAGGAPRLVHVAAHCSPFEPCAAREAPVAWWIGLAALAIALGFGAPATPQRKSA